MLHDVEVWIFLIDYVILMMYYDDDCMGIDGVTCSIPNCPYVLHECDCICDNVKYGCLVVVDLCPSTWCMKNMNMTVELVG